MLEGLTTLDSFLPSHLQKFPVIIKNVSSFRVNALKLRLIRNTYMLINNFILI